MEKLKFKKYPKMNILPLLEGGIEILTIVRSGDFTISTFSPGLDCLMTWLDILHKEITKDLYPQSLTSQDISKTLYALIYRKRVLNYDCEEHISNLALELLHRKNEFGLISKDGVGKRTACMSSQFLAVDALLESYFYCNIDYIYEEALSLFNTIFDIGWNDSLDVFSFNPSQSIVYSSSDIAAVVKCLYHISQWTKNDMRKNKILSIIDTSYLNPIYNNFTDKWEKKIKRMYHIYSITKNPCNHDSSKFNKCTVYRPLYLPDKMVVKYPIHCISWEFSRVLRIWQQFYLCCILLDIHIEEFKTNSTANNDEVDESQIIMDIIKLLFNN